MNRDREYLLLSLLFLLLFFHTIEARHDDMPQKPVIAGSFRPGVAIVVGLLSIVFTFTILLVIYAKFCHTTSSAYFQHEIPPNANLINHGALTRTRSRFSGIDKAAIESLPFFRFSSLKGSKEGLECAVCLSKFEGSEVLRLLPKCKHAFHITCVDRWLESHSSCPICRHKVDPEDHTIFSYSNNSLRFSRNHSELTEDNPNIEIFVHREEDHRSGNSSRFSIGSSFRKIVEKGKKEDLYLLQDCDDDNKKVLHKVKHKIIVTDVILKRRWSDVNSSDLMLLNSEMINAMSSRKFPSFTSDHLPEFSSMPVRIENSPSSSKSIDEKRLFEISKAGELHKCDSVSGSSLLATNSDLEANNTSTNSALLGCSERRAMSEIAYVPRFDGLRTKGSGWEGISGREDHRVRLWFPIARRTVQWLAGRERK